jgi:RNA polymerase sigma-70 factor (ECF subfamily)
VARCGTDAEATDETDHSGMVPGERVRAATPAPRAGTGRRLEAALLGHFGLVWRTLRGLGVDQSTVDDAVQEVFVVLSRRIDEVAPGKERAFLVQAAIRVASNCRRRQRRRREAPAGRLDEHGAAVPDPEHLLQQKQRWALLERLLDTLPDCLRSVFVLFELEGLSSPEIASLLDVPRGTVVSRLRRARESFLQSVANYRTRYSDGERP